MEPRVEVLLATMHEKDIQSVITRMNIQTPIIIANQCDADKYEESNFNGNLARMLSTRTRGVGINRNFALLYAQEDILLFSDNDMKYYSDYEKKILAAFSELPEADIIVFSMDMERNGEKITTYLNQTKRLNVHNIFKYGACTIAVRRRAVQRHHLLFTTLFGGGCIYGSGEDSLFLAECLQKHLNIYSHEAIIGINTCEKSTWFTGYNEKYFYDKGAWIACAMPKSKHLIKYYFLIRLGSVSNLSWKRRLGFLNAGIRGVEHLQSYKDWIENQV